MLFYATEPAAICYRSNGMPAYCCILLVASDQQTRLLSYVKKKKKKTATVSPISQCDFSHQDAGAIVPPLEGRQACDYSRSDTCNC